MVQMILFEVLFIAAFGFLVIKYKTAQRFAYIWFAAGAIAFDRHVAVKYDSVDDYVAFALSLLGIWVLFYVLGRIPTKSIQQAEATEPK